MMRRPRGPGIAVRHYADPSRPWVIPADQYDPNEHELWDADVPPVEAFAPDEVEGVDDVDEPDEVEA